MTENSVGLVERLLSDPPVVHTMGPGRHELGVWQTDRDCYQLIAESISTGSATLETGLGISTALFALTGTRHTCVTPFAAEEERLRSWAAARDVRLDDVDFRIGWSEDVLPVLELEPLDLVLIDGGHGFPVPSLDWYYACRSLRDGGVLILDDVQLPAVALVTDFLDSHPQWVNGIRTDKWASYRRLGDGRLTLDHHHQPWYRSRRPENLGVRELSHHLAAAIGRSARRRFGKASRRGS